MNKRRLMELEITMAVLRGETVVVACPSEAEAKAMMRRFRCDATWPGKKLLGLPTSGAGRSGVGSTLPPARSDPDSQLST